MRGRVSAMSMSGLSQTLQFLFRCVVGGLALACVVILLRPDLLGPREQASVGYADAVAASADAVVNIYTSRLVPSDDPSAESPVAVQTNLGSGVIIDAEGYIVTNFHVIQEARSGRVQLADGREAIPTVVGIDADTDLALLKIELDGLTSIRVGRSDTLQIGDVVLAIGNPYGLSQTVTQGIVSATGRGLLGLTTFENYIQTDAAINSGNSGGALINVRGELIGINTAVVSREVDIEGISFAIPANLVSGVVRALREDGRVRRGWLGLQGQQLTADDWARIGLEPGSGVVLTAVLRDGPAWNAGIRSGDVLLSINGEPLRENQQALLAVASYPPGARLRLEYLRDGQRRSTEAVAGDRTLAITRP